MTSLGACSDDEVNSHDQKVKILTASYWGSPTVTHADGDLSDQYLDFVIVLNKNASDSFDGTYIIANGGYAFSETNGKWKLSDDLTKLVLDSGKEMSVEVSDQSLRLEFTVASTNGRIAGLSGNFVFELKPV